MCFSVCVPLCTLTQAQTCPGVYVDERWSGQFRRVVAPCDTGSNLGYQSCIQAPLSDDPSEALNIQY